MQSHLKTITTTIWRNQQHQLQIHVLNTCIEISITLHTVYICLSKHTILSLYIKKQTCTVKCFKIYPANADHTTTKAYQCGNATQKTLDPALFPKKEDFTFKFTNGWNQDCEKS